MEVFAGLFSLTCASLFFAKAMKRSSALMPLLAIGISMLFFMVAGIFNFLPVAGYLWYGLCAAGLIWVILKEKKNIFALFSPGLVFFLLASTGFILYFWATQPMLTHWDEFTFWGTAAKVTQNAGELYTTAHSNLIARTYPPGLIVYTYMMQFWGGFTEPGYMAAFAVFYMASFSAASALWEKNRTATAVYLAAFFLLPFFFSLNQPMGQMQWTYIVCMADLPLSVLFGGILCFYYAGGEKNGPLLISLGVLLAALVSIKDMGLALAMVALAVLGLDLIFCEWERFGLWALKKWKGLLAFLVYGLAMIAGSYLFWAWHLAQGAGKNRFDLGSAGVSLGILEMPVLGLKMLFGMDRSEQFSIVLEEMGRAFFQRPISLAGSGAAVLGLILALSAMAWVLSATQRQRRRILVFTLAMALGFAAFYVFNIFTYGLVFKYQEAIELKDYQRYIGPYWTAWMMGTFCLLSRAATNPKATFYRLRIARSASVVSCAFLVLFVCLLGNWKGNFLRLSPSFFGARKSVQQVVEIAKQEGMQNQDVVYIISQGDDGSRFYLFGYEMQATRSLLFFGYYYDLSGKLVLNEADMPQYYGNVAVTLVPYGTENPPLYAMEGNQADLLAFLREQKCTHILIDVPDEYILDEFGPLFSDELAGWDPADPFARGQRYYRIEWKGENEAVFIPALQQQGGGKT